MKITKFLTIFSLLLLFTSCSDDESTNNIDNNDDTNTETLLRERITQYDNETITEFFNYDSNKNLASIIDSDGFSYNYIYENNLLKRINYTDSDANIIDYTNLNYDDTNNLINYVVYIPDNDEGLKFDLEYNSDQTITIKEYRGDLVNQNSLIGESTINLSNKQKVSEIGNDYSINYSYDNKNGIYKNISNIETLNLINIDFNGYIESGNNNIIRINEEENGNNIIFDEYEYIYNNDNYPVSATYLYDGELDSTIQYIYE